VTIYEIPEDLDIISEDQWDQPCNASPVEDVLELMGLANEFGEPFNTIYINPPACEFALIAPDKRLRRRWRRYKKMGKNTDTWLANRFHRRMKVEPTPSI